MAETEPQNEQPVDFSDRLKNVSLTLKPKSFNADSYLRPESRLMHWTIKYSNGLIKNERQANFFFRGINNFVMAVISRAVKNSSKIQRQNSRRCSKIQRFQTKRFYAYRITGGYFYNKPFGKHRPGFSFKRAHESQRRVKNACS